MSVSYTEIESAKNRLEEMPLAETAPSAGIESVIRRDSSLMPYDRSRIHLAIEKAFRADQRIRHGSNMDATLQRTVSRLVGNVEETLRQNGNTKSPTVEEIQDSVETVLMDQGHYSVARRYIVYREEHAKARILRGSTDVPVVNRTDVQDVDWEEIGRRLNSACRGLSSISAAEMLEDAARSTYAGISEAEMDRLLVLTARSRIESEPLYSLIATRLLLDIIDKEVMGFPIDREERDYFHQQYLGQYISEGIQAGRLSEELASFDLRRLAEVLRTERDELFPYMGLQTIYDRYLLHIDKRRFETPQYFWMRVAMGLALRENQREERAIEFYQMMSTFRFLPSTPTLFNAGTCHPQLSSCFLTTFQDDLCEIFKGISDNARLSKWAGGLGNDWTNVRAIGSNIKGTNGESQGIIPFLKVANATAVAVNQGGKRQGAVCAYLECWHMDFEEFLDLRKNTGDERRRTHDMNTAAWVPDLFIKRIKENGVWTLFTPNEVPDLHDCYGRTFEDRYRTYEQQALDGGIKHWKQIPAVELWRKMLSSLFETGHPWVTFKDPSNVRSPQDHTGVVHSSNLCTEILLNTSAEETAVCNLGSVNLLAHMENGALQQEKLNRTVATAVRMLDNVIDINFYPTPEARNSNLRHRPVGLGLMGFQDCLYELGVSFAGEQAVAFADESMERISYAAILASISLAEERGAYPSYSGSKWDRGLLPIDTIDLLEQERGCVLDVDRTQRLDWQPVREALARCGMRNSNVMAIAPTATIANIIGVTPSIEPTFRNLFVKSNMSGDFVVMNPALVKELRGRGLWNQAMLDDLKYFDGSLQDIPHIPAELKEMFRTAFEIDPAWLIECASRRQKWIDMGQSLNLFVTSTSGKQLSEMYLLAWEKGLKTTYYLRSQAATQIEKSTLDVNRHGIQPRWMKNRSASSDLQVERAEQPRACSLENPECEVCQ
jgi:ribonucleoside-diphosphate reductase alpha chain